MSGEKGKRAAKELIELDKIEFLKALVAKYPETKLLAGAAQASPEGNQKLKEEALAYKVFDKSVEINPTAIEADRTFLGLLVFKAGILKSVMTGDREMFPNLSDNGFKKLQEFTNSIVKTEEDLELCLYALACNDLGKTQKLVDEHYALTGNKDADHDQVLYTLTKLNPERFEGFCKLSPEQQNLYLEGLGADLNLGQYVQGENLPYNLEGMQKISQKGRDLRLIAELYDFAGVTGHINPNVSLVMNDDNLMAFTTAIKELMTEPQEFAYQRYIARRGQKAGIDSNTPCGYAQSRVAAMARVFTKEKGQVIKDVWAKLPDNTKKILEDELNETGQGKRKAILIYYAPAVIANAVQSSKDFNKGLERGLKALAKVFDDTRKQQNNDNGRGVISINVSSLAKSMLVAEQVKHKICNLSRS